MREFSEWVTRRRALWARGRASHGVLLGLIALSATSYASCSGVDDSRAELTPTCVDDDCGRVGEIPKSASTGGASAAGGTGGQLGLAGVPSVGGGLGVPVPGSPPVDAGVDAALGAPVETVTGGQPAVDTAAAANASLGVPVPGTPPVDVGIEPALGTPVETLTGGQPGTITPVSSGGTGVVAAQTDPVESTF